MLLKSVKQPNEEAVSDGRGHMQVVVRVRPENSKEVESGFPRRIVEVISRSSLVFDPYIADDAPQFCPGEQIREERQRVADRARLLRFRRREKNLTFNFNRVFDETVGNNDVYNETTSKMLDAFVTGINCSVFCYGATGAGKTFTMLGGRSQSGVIFFTMRALYDRVRSLVSTGAQYNVKVSYLEIYNEQVHDLLAKWSADYLDDDTFDAFLKARTSERERQGQNDAQPNNNSEEPNAKRPRFGGSATSKTGSGAAKRTAARRAQDGSDLLLLEDAQVGVVVHGITYHEPTSAEELMRMLEYGNLLRTQHPTDANSESSRSHAVFQVYFRQKVLDCAPSSTTNGTVESLTYRTAKFSLIDLAGSERATATSNNGLRFREGANINKSLLALGNCINALADGKKVAHIPYRNSKLTRLLKDSLAGNCQTCMIAAVSPSAVSYEDTYNTLKYADRARAIQIESHQNVVNATIGALDLSKIVDQLRRENAQLRSQISTPDSIGTELPPPATVVPPKRPLTASVPSSSTTQEPFAQVSRPTPAAVAAAASVPPLQQPAQDPLVLDKLRARLLERDLRLFRKIECWRRLKALNIDSDAMQRARDRAALFIDSNYLEVTDTNALVTKDDEAATSSSAAESETNLDTVTSLVGALCAEADEDKALIRDLLSTVGRFFVLLKCEHLVTQANVDEIEHLKQRIIALENARTRQYRQPLTRATMQAATKREAGGVRWAERLEVDEPRIAYIDDIPTSEQFPSQSRSADDQCALSELAHADRVRGLNASTLSRLHVASAVRSLFTAASDKANAAKTKKSPANATQQKVNVNASRPLSASNGDNTSSAMLDETVVEKLRFNIVVDEVDRYKKRNGEQAVEDAEDGDEGSDSHCKQGDKSSDDSDMDVAASALEGKVTDSTFTIDIDRNAAAAADEDSADTSVLANRDVNQTFVIEQQTAKASSQLVSRVRDSMMIKRPRPGLATTAAAIEDCINEDEEEHENSNEDTMNGTFTCDDAAAQPESDSNANIIVQTARSPAKTNLVTVSGGTPKTTKGLNESSGNGAPTGLISSAQRDPERYSRRLARKRASSMAIGELRNENDFGTDSRPIKQLRMDPAIESLNLMSSTTSNLNLNLNSGVGLNFAIKPLFTCVPVARPARSRDDLSTRRPHHSTQRGAPLKMRRFTSATNFNTNNATTTSSNTAQSGSNANRLTNRLGNGLFTFTKSISDVLNCAPAATVAPATRTTGLGLGLGLFSAALPEASTSTTCAPNPDRPVLKARRLTVRPSNVVVISAPIAAVPVAAPAPVNRLFASTMSWNLKQVARQPQVGHKRPV